MDTHLFGVVWALTTLSLTLLWDTSESFNLDVRYPIIFEDPAIHSGRGSYFGYSLIMYSGEGKNSKSWIMVGAPRGNSSFEEHLGIREPGQVYKCSLSPLGQCEPLQLDFKGNECEDLEADLYCDYKDGAWIGATMAEQVAPEGRVVICGPRWIDQVHKNISGNIYQVGVCYWAPAEAKDDYQKLLPLVGGQYRQFTNHSEMNDEYKYDFGQAGFSVSIPLKKSPKERTQLLLGAPGISNYRGGVVFQQDGVTSESGGVSKRSVAYTDFAEELGTFSELPNTPYDLSDFGYLGYQVSSGYITDKNELIYVASAPRAANLKGKVLIFKLNDKKDNKHSSGVKAIEKHATFVGYKVGEYYGASLAVGDLNNDGYDDIIVGAPLYTEGNMGCDEGRISVIFGKNDVLSEDKKVVGKVVGARFGSAVSYLGNLDSDSFAEIGVGAPFEDEGRGVVYILSRGKSGHWDAIVQRLTARDIYPNLRGFGSSIVVHPADIDGNGCLDVAVGAYKSGHAAVFRGQPVVKWITNQNQIHSHIPHNPGSLSLLEACISYQGKHVPVNLEVIRIIEMDPIYKRCRIKNEMLNSETINLKKNAKFCETINITILPGILDVTNPVEVKILYQLIEKNETLKNDTKVQPILITRDGIKEGPEHFCKTCPISQSSPSQKLFIPFEVECGDDNICEADLKIMGYFPDLSHNEESISFTVGSNNTLIFKVKVLNKNNTELAYFTRVYIELGSPITISRIPPTCSEISSFPSPNPLPLDSEFGTEESLPSNTSSTRSTYIQCNLGLQLSASNYMEFIMELDMTDLQGSERIKLSAWTTTASKEINPSDNYWHMYLPLRYEADIAIAGKSSMEVYDFKDNKNKAGNKINVLHTYEVQKFGVSPVEKVIIEFHIPYSIENHNKDPVSFLKLKSFEGNQDGQPLSCDSTTETEQSKTRRKKSLNAVNSTGVYLTNNATNQVPSNRTLYLNCSSLARHVYPRILCKKVSCRTMPFRNSLIASRVYLSMELDTESLREVKDNKDIILLETLGTVRVVEPVDLQQPALQKSRPDQTWTSTLFVGDIPAKKVESWLIALAIIAGIFLLMLLGLALYKAGFFKRKKKEELDELKNQIISNTNNEVAATE